VGGVEGAEDGVVGGGDRELLDCRKVREVFRVVDFCNLLTAVKFCLVPVNAGDDLSLSWVLVSRFL
jgi:hypothetical protein